MNVFINLTIIPFYGISSCTAHNQTLSAFWFILRIGLGVFLWLSSVESSLLIRADCLLNLLNFLSNSVFQRKFQKQAEFYSPEIQGCDYAIDFSHFFKDFNLPNLMVILLPRLPSAFISVVGYSFFVTDPIEYHNYLTHQSTASRNQYFRVT